MIDSKLFKEMYDEIDKKVQLIRVLPMLNIQEQDYMGFTIEDDEISIESEYYYSGCGTDTSYLYIPLAEINNSVEWFEKKFQKEIDDEKEKQDEIKRVEKERVAENRRVSKENKKKNDMLTYRRIKKELGL